MMISQLYSDLAYSHLSVKNMSHEQSQLVITEYFIDQEKYSRFLLFHTVVATFIGSIAMVATGSTLIVYLQHACGMFKIARYQNNHKLQQLNVL